MDSGNMESSRTNARNFKYTELSGVLNYGFQTKLFWVYSGVEKLSNKEKDILTYKDEEFNTLCNSTAHSLLNSNKVCQLKDKNFMV